MEYAKLNNGVRMPMLGYGVFQVSNEECERCVLDAIDVGYRLIDTAQAYGNEEGVGNAIAHCSMSNFYPDRFIDLCEFVRVMPAVNQIETHVFHQQKTAHTYMRKYGTQHEAWGPFAEGRKDFFTNPRLTEIGSKYGKTAAQVALRFLIQSGIVAIPKSTHKERMEQNYHIFDFALDEDDMCRIAELDAEESLFFSHYDPATVERLVSYGKSK